MDFFPKAGIRYGSTTFLSFLSPALMIVSSAALALEHKNSILVTVFVLVTTADTYFAGRPKIGVARKPAPSSLARLCSSRVKAGAIVLISQKMVLLFFGKCSKSF
jgi:hypothetical protein